MTNEVKEKLTKLANRDLVAARKKGATTVSRTIYGNVLIDYFPLERAYSVYYPNGRSLHKLKASEAQRFLVYAYNATVLL